MPNVPAVCPQCHLVFPSPIAIAEGVRGASIYNIGVQCPRCGGNGRILDGIYDALGNTIRVLLTSNRSIEQLETLRHALKTARESKASRQEIGDTIKAHTPELQQIADALPQTRVELYAFITMLGVILTAIIAASGVFQKKGPTDAEINAMVEKAVVQACQLSAPTLQTKNRQDRRARGRPPKPAHHK